jgi:predicted SprT family Zn-dependent metalloprotease
MKRTRANMQGAAIMADQEVRDWIRFACDCNGCPALADRIDIEWSNRMTRAMGRIGRNGYEDVGGRRWKMKLSVGLFGNASSEERYNTIIHETCHAIDDYINCGWCSELEGHGEPWRRIMRKCGIEPARYHRVSRSGLVMRHEYECPNGCDVFKLSTRMHNSVKRGRHRVCRKCRSRIKYTGRSSKNL